MNQARMITSESTYLQYALDTADPVASQSHISRGAYHYYLVLCQKYSRLSCPLYLTPRGFEMLKENGGERMGKVEIWTREMVGVLDGLEEGGLGVWVGM